MSVFNPSKNIWTERFRPQKVSDIVGSFKGKILEYLKNPKALPNFLLYSRVAGTGKTTVLKAIINELGCDALLLNSSDERGIETIRDKIKEFAKTKSTKEGLRKCVALDEAEGLTFQAQEALRNTMETYSSNVFFILTCNTLAKISAPIRSRCVEISFAYPDKKEIYDYLKMICDTEQMQYTEEGINQLIELNYPSIRNCVISLQDLYTEKKTVVPENVRPVNEAYEVLWTMVKEKRWKEIKEAVLQSSLDTRELNNYFWRRALEEENMKTLQICCRNEKDIAFGASADIIFITSIYEICR